MNKIILLIFSYFYLNLSLINADFEDKINILKFEGGKGLFISNCIACHSSGKNMIIPEKNLEYQALENNGMNIVESISYQIRNGKNGMPAFGGRLTEKEIDRISKYILETSFKNLKENKNFFPD